MSIFQLTNEQREYFGLDLINPSWDIVNLPKGPHRPESTLYFDGDKLKKQIISNDDRYYEWTVNQNTRARTFILPKTGSGKEKKISSYTLEKSRPEGVSFDWISSGIVTITNHNAQINYYSNYREEFRIKNLEELETWVCDWVTNSSSQDLTQINAFKTATRKNVKYKPGDFFAFRIGRNEYGFGRILMDINKLRRKKLIPKIHGLQLIIGPPLLVKIYAYTSNTFEVDVDLLRHEACLPSDYIMDNHIFYGEYPIIGERRLEPDEFEFPISYGRSIDFSRKVVFLQWGLIHLELPLSVYDKYIYLDENINREHNPYGYYSVGFYHRYFSNEIKRTAIEKVYDFDAGAFKAEYDLRNPRNRKIKNDIFEVFGLDPERSYLENCLRVGVEPFDCN